MLAINDNNFHTIVKTLVLDQRKVTKGVNLQNIPSRTTEGKKIRKCLIPPDGYKFIGADLSQAEPRVMAHIMWKKYNDNSLRQIFLDGNDLYTTMAMLAFDLPQEYCMDGAWYDPISKKGGVGGDRPDSSYEPRKMMKQGILALGYQQSEKRFAETMKVSLDIAKLVFEKFDTSFPSFKKMVKDTVEFMKKNGYVETLFGRKRRFPDYKKMARLAKQNESRIYEIYRKLKKTKDPKVKTKLEQELTILRQPKSRMKGMEREAFNAVIQGSATSDIIKINGNKMARVCRERGWLMPATIHDEIIIAVPDRDVTMETINLVQDIMCNSVSDVLDVPLKSDVVIMPRWEENYSPDEWDFENCCPKVS